jgi:hypothetical protein
MPGRADAFSTKIFGCPDAQMPSPQIIYAVTFGKKTTHRFCMPFVGHKCPPPVIAKSAPSLFDTRTVAILFVPSVSVLLAGKIFVQKASVLLVGRLFVQKVSVLLVGRIKILSISARMLLYIYEILIILLFCVTFISNNDIIF